MQQYHNDISNHGINFPISGVSKCEVGALSAQPVMPIYCLTNPVYSPLTLGLQNDIDDNVDDENNEHDDNDDDDNGDESSLMTTIMKTVCDERGGERSYTFTSWISLCIWQANCHSNANQNTSKLQIIRLGEYH